MVHRTVTVVVRCAIAFQIRHIRLLVLGVDLRTGHYPVHTRQSGVPNRPLVWATRRPLIVLATVGSGGSDSPDGPVHHRTVR